MRDEVFKLWLLDFARLIVKVGALCWAWSKLLSLAYWMAAR